MPRRDEEDVTLCCPLDDREQDFAATMMQMTSTTSEANLVRLGLWHLAKFLKLPIGNAFGPRKWRSVKANRLVARQLSVLEISEGGDEGDEKA